MPDGGKHDEHGKRRGGNRKSSYLEETDGFEYVEKTQAVTNLGDLLKGIKLD